MIREKPLGDTMVIIDAENQGVGMNGHGAWAWDDAMGWAAGTQRGRGRGRGGCRQGDLELRWLSD